MHSFSRRRKERRIAKNALITGVSSGIGEALAQMFLKRGYMVYGISRSPAYSLMEEERFIHLSFDLNGGYDERLLRLAKEVDMDILINNAGVGSFAPHEEIAPEMIASMCDLNLKAPLLLCNLFLRGLKRKQGCICNITSIEALRYSRLSAVYSGTKAGLRSFSLALFEEVRKSGVKVVSINPDMTDTPFFDDKSFGVGGEGSFLYAKDVAAVVDDIIAKEPRVAVTDITIRPQFFGITKKKRGKR